jgi:hypothetical protein
MISKPKLGPVILAIALGAMLAFLFSTCQKCCAAQLTIELTNTLAVGTPKLNANFTNLFGYATNVGLWTNAQGPVNVKYYGAKGDTNTDDTAAIVSAIAAADHVFMPAGVYLISSTIEIEKDGFRLTGDGTNTCIIYTTNSAVESMIHVKGRKVNNTLENLTLIGNEYVTNAVKLGQTYHALIRNIRARNTQNGFFLISNVLNQIDTISVSSNEYPTQTNLPYYGLLMNWCNSVLVNNVIMEGVTVGIMLTNGCAQNQFNSGSSEGNDYGVVISSTSARNVFVNMDCESNSVRDFEVNGNLNTFVNCLADNAFYLNAPHNRLYGGACNDLEITSNSQHSAVYGTAYSVLGTGTFTDNGYKTTLIPIVDLFTAVPTTKIWPSAGSYEVTPWDIVGQAGDTNYYARVVDEAVGAGDVAWHIATKIPSAVLTTNLTLRTYPNYVSTPGYFDATNGYYFSGVAGTSTTNTIFDRGGTNWTITVQGGIVTSVASNVVDQWEDLQVPGLSAKTGASAPSLGNFLGAGGLQIYLFQAASVDDQVYFTVQFPHAYKEGTDVEPHVHWTQTAATGAGTNVVWGLEYSWANANTEFPAVATIYVTNTISGTNWQHQIASFPTVSGTNKTVSSIMNCRLFRAGNSATADDYDQNAALLQFDIHYKRDSNGSVNELSK